MRIAKTLLKFLAWCVGVVFALGVAIYLVAIGINWNDQAASEASIRLDKLGRDGAPIPHEDNAYVYVVGFTVAPEEDPSAWGARRLAWTEHVLVQPPSAPVTGFPGENHDFKSLRSTAVQELSEACRKVDPKCLGALERGDGNVAAWLGAEGWVLARYKTLLGHKGWRETVPWDARVPLPEYSSVLEGQKLLLAEAWTLAGHREAAGVRRLLEADVRFWRHTLAATNNLISKMIATAALHRHFAWSNLVLRRLPPDAARNAIPEPWRAPISESERSMLRSLAGEWAFFDHAIRHAMEDDVYPLDMSSDEASTAKRLFWRVTHPMLKVQDTSNQYADLLISVSETLQVPFDRYPEAIDHARAISDDAVQGAFPPTRIYNVLGDILLAVANPDLTSYAARVADLEGIRRSTLLAVELRSQGIAAAQAPQNLMEATLKDPYSGKPFGWDEGAKAIVFVGLQPGERGRHTILY
jgi:hypothetical protein